MENLPQKIRSKKLSTKVDLTAMVSVSFLLIIFFMVTIELAKPNIMEQSFSNGGGCGGEPICYKPDENRILTVLLDDNDKIVTYMGLLYAPIQNPKEVEYGKDGIRKELLYIDKKVHEYSASMGKPKIGVSVIIKPSNKSNYGNLVSILDEMKIAGIKSYSIIDYFTPEESKLLASN
ncbi:MAG: biopolymer transporter ExbD [Flavobacterium sp.]